MTRYLLCEDVILNQTTDQTTYVRQGINEQTLDKQFSDLRFQAPDHDKMIGQRHCPYDHELVWNEYLENFNMIYPRDEDSDPYKKKTVDIYKKNHK